MENQEKGYFSPEIGRGMKNTARNEKSQQRANMEATGQKQPHFRNMEEVHAYHQAMDDRANKQRQTSILKSLKDFHRHTEKAKEAIKPLSEGLVASLDIDKVPNRLDLPRGGYNPGYLEWMESNLTLSALALCEILTHDSIDESGYIAVWKETAERLITDMQHHVMNFQQEVISLRFVLEQYNYYTAYMEERGLKDDFENYISLLFLAK